MPTTSSNGTSKRTRSNRTVGDVKSKLTAQNEIDPKTKEANKARRAKVKKDTAELTIDKAASTIAKTKVQIQQSLDVINAELTTKLDELKTVNEAIEVAQQELEELHDKDVVASSTAELIERHEHKKKELEERIEELRAAWDKEQQEHQEKVREREAHLAKERQREIDEYNYKLKIERRNEEEEYQEQIRQRNLHNQQKQEALLKDWKEREAAIQAKEDEYKELQEKVINFDKQLKDEVAKQTAIVSNQLKRDHKVEVDRLNMQTDADKRLLQQSIENLHETIQSKNNYIAQLQQELKDAKEQTSNMATKAMEVSSGRQALEAVNDFANKSSGNSNKK